MKLPLRHGLTLLELLIALTLMGAMVVSLAQWVSLAADARMRCSQQVDSIGPTLAFFQLIQDELDAVAFPTKDASQASTRSKAVATNEERVRVDEKAATVSIATRIPARHLSSAMAGPVDAIVRYRWDRKSAVLVRECLTISGETIAGTERDVLAGVEMFRCSIAEDQLPLLTLEVAIGRGDAVKRSFQLR